MRDVDVAVVGGGCIGLAVAAELADYFSSVALFDRDYTGSEATGAAGGMLAPIMELEFEEFELLELGRQSLHMFPQYCRRLEDETGMEVGLRQQGTFYVATHERQLQEVKRLYEYQQRLGLEVERLPVEILKKRQPALTDQLVGGLWIADEKHIDNRKFAAALYLLCRERGVEIHTNDPLVDLEYDSAARIKTLHSNFTSVQPDLVVLAAGAWTGLLPGLAEQDRLPVRPVKGQAVAVGLDSSFSPDSIVHSPDVYCVPHSPDRMILGATMEEKGFERRVRFGGLYDLLFSAAEILPALRDQPFLETWVGHRPASFDSLPFIGPALSTENLYFAAGHYRNGILHTPITAKLLKKMIVDSTTPELVEPFLPTRQRLLI